MEIFLYSFINHAYLKGLIGEVYILNSLEEKQTNIYTILSVECGSPKWAFYGGGGAGQRDSASHLVSHSISQPICLPVFISFNLF